MSTCAHPIVRESVFLPQLVALTHCSSHPLAHLAKCFDRALTAVQVCRQAGGVR